MLCRDSTEAVVLDVEARTVPFSAFQPDAITGRQFASAVGTDDLAVDTAGQHGTAQLREAAARCAGEGAGQNRDQLTAAGYIVLADQHGRGDLDTDFKLFLQMGFRHHDHPFQKNPQNVAGFWFYYTSLRKKVQFPVGVYIQFIAFWVNAM